MLLTLSHLRLEHPRWSYAETLLAGAVLVWWALGYRKAAGVFGLVMLARFRLSLVFKAHETAVGIGYWTAPETQGKGLATRAVRLLSRWALQHAEVIRIEALLDPCNERRASARRREPAAFNRKGSFGSTSSSTATVSTHSHTRCCDPISDGADRT